MVRSEGKNNKGYHHSKSSSYNSYNGYSKYLENKVTGILNNVARKSLNDFWNKTEKIAKWIQNRKKAPLG